MVCCNCFGAPPQQFAARAEAMNDSYLDVLAFDTSFTLVESVVSARHARSLVINEASYLCCYELCCCVAVLVGDIRSAVTGLLLFCFFFLAMFCFQTQKNKQAQTGSEESFIGRQRRVCTYYEYSSLEEPPRGLEQQHRVPKRLSACCVFAGYIHTRNRREVYS